MLEFLVVVVLGSICHCETLWGLYVTLKHFGSLCHFETFWVYISL